MTRLDIEIPEGLIVEGHQIQPPKLVILKAYPSPEGGYVSLVPINGEPWHVQVEPEALIKGGPVAPNLRVLGIIPPEANLRK